MAHINYIFSKEKKRKHYNMYHTMHNFLYQLYKLTVNVTLITCIKVSYSLVRIPNIKSYNTLLNISRHRKTVILKS